MAESQTVQPASISLGSGVLSSQPDGHNPFTAQGLLGCRESLNCPSPTVFP